MHQLRAITLKQSAKYWFSGQTQSVMQLLLPECWNT